MKEYASPDEIVQAAEDFITALGSENVRYLDENLQHVRVASDALLALMLAIGRSWKREA